MPPGSYDICPVGGQVLSFEVSLLVVIIEILKLSLVQTPLIYPQWYTEGFSKSYTRAFGDGPRNFEPWSSEVDDT
ncbi:hypothetical protein TNCV_3094031 [Trichonephila clavipes]|nr:hypothetical protein TNCV_3094031 [Trichonephila clavipes]